MAEVFYSPSARKDGGVEKANPRNEGRKGGIYDSDLEALERFGIASHPQVSILKGF